MKRVSFIFFTLLIQSASLAHAYDVYDDTSYVECGSESNTSVRSFKLHYLYWPEAYAVGFFADYVVPGKTGIGTPMTTSQGCIISALATEGENIILKDREASCGVVISPSNKKSQNGAPLYRVRFNREAPLDHCTFTTPKEELLKAFGR